MTDDDLEEWRAHPLTVLVRDAARAFLAREKHELTEAWWAGLNQDTALLERAVFLRKSAMIVDIFDDAGASAADMQAWIKQEDD